MSPAPTASPPPSPEPQPPACLRSPLPECLSYWVLSKNDPKSISQNYLMECFFFLSVVMIMQYDILKRDSQVNIFLLKFIGFYFRK